MSQAANDQPTFPLSDQQRIDWMRLMRTEGVGPLTFRRLINRHGGTAAALRELARSGRGPKPADQRQVETELDRAARLGARIVGWGEPDYPPALRAIDSAPPLITVRGRAELLALPCVAIVGARNASALGQRFAALLARGLGEAGFVVVSGLARGIDGAAHEAALPTGTAGVLAGGLARLYPPEHRALADRMAERGCLVSEMPLEWTATARDFPRRNRIISGLSLGTVIVEAALRSGSLISARFAAEQGREVFAVPGSPLDPRAEGTNRLIREGATLVTGVQDVVDALEPLLAEPTRKQASNLAERERPGDPWDEWLDEPTASTPEGGDSRILGLIGAAPVSVDELTRLAGMPPREVQAILLDLHLAGRIERHGQSLVSLA